MWIFFGLQPICEKIKWYSPGHILSMVNSPFTSLVVPLEISWIYIFTKDKGSSVDSSKELPFIEKLQSCPNVLEQ